MLIQAFGITVSHSFPSTFPGSLLLRPFAFFLLSAVPFGAVLELTYTRSKAAFLNGVSFQVQSADTLGGTWTTPAVSPETILSDNGTTQTVKVTVPLATSQRFLRLSVTAP